MPTRPRGAGRWLLLALAGPACQVIARDNPLDLGAPVPVQRRASLRVTVAAQGDGPEAAPTPLPGAVVEIQGAVGGLRAQQATGATGDALFAALQADTYAIVGSATGYYGGLQQVSLYPGDALARTVVLAPGSGGAAADAAALRCAAAATLFDR